MKAAVCEEPHKIILRDVNVPGPGPGEVLVKVKASGICRSDVKGYLGTHPGVIYPMILGHEFSGEVAALGEGVESAYGDAPLEVGDGVIVEPLFPCGECTACLAGDYNLCYGLTMAGHQAPGSFAEYAIARAALLYPKDQSLSFDEAALMEPLAVAVHAVKRAGTSIGDMVVVLGSGTIGLLTMQVAKKAGATVIATDVSGDKLHLAADLGADYVVNADTSDPCELVMAVTRDRGADVVIDCAGTPQTLMQTVDLVRKGGTVTMIGWTGEESDRISLTKITRREINLLGSIIYCRDFPTAIELAVSRNVNLSSIITHEFELAEVPEALEQLSRDGHEVIKAIVKFAEQED
jgi:L-iditol 2-dehydrogenase